MHEFSICEGIVKGIMDEYEKLGPRAGKLQKVHVVVGGLHQVVPDYLETAYEVLT
ncbi:MAG: hydrogenase maturation nickel metallochaperone HypA, partial [Verrucomicrobia bacterium]|nr:hydrogenase maturation nickel metallochaperone HypA [Verrucomicrobiota bacterium]